MGLKKYEIITVGSDRRVRALRSWAVGGRYVNIGDVGGIVYDEKTLSQDGLCWLFKGNFGFPGARIGGDSIVDVAEATLSAFGTPNVDVLGSSVVVGSKLQFASDKTAANAVVLGADDFEQGDYTFVKGAKSENQKFNNPKVVRTKSPIFRGGVSTTLKLDVPGYAVQAFGLDADLVMVSATVNTVTGAGVTLIVPAAQYCVIRLHKLPVADTVPADATTAAITFTGTYETKLSIIDSRVEVNPANATGTATIKPGGTYTMASGVKYPEAIIRNSKVSVMVHATANRVCRIMGQIIGSTATLDATASDVTVAGQYSNVKNLMASGVLTTSTGVSAYNLIQATDCDNFAVSPTIFPGLAAALTANVPFIFQGCNVPGGRFQHAPRINNTYINIDFAKAQTDLNKVVSGFYMCSSNVEGMYRLGTSNNILGCLVESYESVKSFSIPASDSGYNTTIYKDAYVSGKFDIAGTNVFGHKVRSHPLAQVLNVQPRAVQGNLNTATVGQTITGVIPSDIRVCIPTPIRINGANGFKIEGLSATLEALVIFVTPSNVVTAVASSSNGVFSFPAAQLNAYAAYVRFGKTGGAAITPEDLAGVTVTVYNGCKIVNTGATAVNMKGSIRVEDNATLVNASVTGTGYFGDNSVTYYNPAVWASLDLTGTVHMKGNAVFAPTAITGACALVHMQDNAKFIGSVTRPSTELSFIMGNNAIIEGISNTRSGVVMSGNSKVTATGQIAEGCRGVLVMKDNASIEAVTTVIGAITLAGNYKGNVIKTWTGKRTITDVNEPEYDNNVKSKYDL